MSVWIKFATPEQRTDDASRRTCGSRRGSTGTGSRWVALQAENVPPCPTADMDPARMKRMRVDDDVPSDGHVQDQDSRRHRATRGQRPNGALDARRLLTGAYGFIRTFALPTCVLEGKHRRLRRRRSRPFSTDLRLGYVYRSPWERPGALLHIQRLSIPGSHAGHALAGSPFPAFRPVADITPALYLGFDLTAARGSRRRVRGRAR